VSAHRYCPSCAFPLEDIVGQDVDALIGTTLPGGYIIRELVGVGGMGRVYRAEQKALGRTVAVKIVHPHLLGDGSASMRFITEARAASRLNHPNSVSVIDFGKNGEQLYLVMEFLRGRDLARVIYDDGPLPFSRCLDVLIQVLAALGEAHALEIVHRDLKPENIVLEPKRSDGDFVKVVDFGLAKMHETVHATSVTSPGIVCGTPDYMAPEQGRGDAIDARTDLYACGVILFYLLTGRLPFEADSPTKVVLMHITAPVPDPSVVAPERGIPDALVALTRKALAKDPADRYQSADEFADALRGVLPTLEGARSSSGEIGVACTECQIMVPMGQKFCGNCGARVARKAHGPAVQSLKKPAESIPSLPLPFSARGEDLDWLDACRYEASLSVTGARIVGEAGVGKTRLLDEMIRSAEAAGDLIVRVQPDPWQAEVSLHALRTIVPRLTGLPSDGGAAAQWVGAQPQARRGLEAIFNRHSIQVRSEEPTALSPDGIRRAIAESLRWAVTLAHKAAPTRRMLLVIDDLHAIDGPSRNAFADILNEPPLASLLLVATHPPHFHAEWPGEVRVLAGLPTHVAAALTRGTQPSSATSTSEPTIPPLYVEQLIRFTMEGRRDPPPRLADLIALRIEHLRPEARRLLQAIAVVGSEATESTLRRVLGDQGALGSARDALVAAGMILAPEPAPSQALYSTSHPLIRDVTLATIPAAVRRRLHANAAANADTLPLEARALHAYYAEDSFEALMLLEQVADRAGTQGDQAGSVLALRRGLDLSRRELFRGELDDPERAVLIFSRKLGDALTSSGALTDAEGVLREALDLAGPRGRERAHLLGSLARVAEKRKRTKEASDHLREALSLAKQAHASDVVDSLERMRTQWQLR
jgi:serine/threonine-protein kinase